MHDKYTTLLSLAPAGMSVVPADACCIAFNVQNNAIREFPAGRQLPPRNAGESFYAVPTMPFETLFAVHGAILCTKPNGNEARPGMSLRLRFSYISSLGLQKLLLLYRQRVGRVPECITLEDLHMLLHDEIRSICSRVATEFSHSVTLPYAHWWNEISYSSAYRDKLYTPLMQLFMSFGMMLDQADFTINSLAQLSVD